DLALHLDLFLAADSRSSSPLAVAWWSSPRPALAGRGAPCITMRDDLDGDDVRRLRALRPLAGLVLDLRVLGERLESLAGNVAVVDEEVLASLVRRDEAVALRVVEPLHGSCCHAYTSSHPLSNG